LSHDERERLLRQGPAAGKTGLVDLPQAACFSGYPDYPVDYRCCGAAIS